MVEGGITLVKYLLFFANFILWVMGLSMITAGAVLQLKYSGTLDILGDQKLATPVLLLALGCLCTLLGFLGYCGAIRENYCLTVSFAVLLALLMLTEIAAAIASYALHEPLHKALVKQLTQGMVRYNQSRGVEMAWDETQRQLRCCGVNNASDWGPIAPVSCCVHPHQGCSQLIQPLLHTVRSIHFLPLIKVGTMAHSRSTTSVQSGCVQAIQNWIVSNATLFGGLTALLAAVQIVGICFACCLSKSILKDFHDFYY